MIFWEWLTYYLDRSELINWVIDKGCHLHPIFKEKIIRKLSKKKLNDECRIFWEIVTSDDYEKDSRQYYQELEGDKLDHCFMKQIFFHSIMPKFIFEKDFLSIDNTRIYSSSVRINLTEYQYEHYLVDKNYKQHFRNLIIPVSNFLNQAMEFWERLGKENKYFDCSAIDMPSIALHEQNRRFESWVILIEICRDLWRACNEVDPQFSREVIQIWRRYDYPVFRRLVLYAMTESDIYNSDEIIDYLLEDDGYWLVYSFAAKRERFRLLEKICRNHSKCDSERLIQAVLDFDFSKFDANRKIEISEHTIWKLLKKIQLYGVTLNEAAKHKIFHIEKEHPEWKFSNDEKDEFSFYITCTSGFSKDITIEELLKLSAHQLVIFLKEKSSYRDGRLSVFHDAYKQYPEKIPEVLTLILKETISEAGGVFTTALNALKNSHDPQWQTVIKIVCNIDDEYYKNYSHAIASWLQKAIDNINIIDDGGEEYFWDVIFKVLENMHDCSADEKDNIKRSAVSFAINHPVGMTALIVTDELIKQKKSGPKLLESGRFCEYLDCVLANKKNTFLLAEVILAARLNFIYELNPHWTKEKFLPRFDWAGSEQDNLKSFCLWQGFLWTSQLSPDLTNEIKSKLLETINEYINKFSDKNKRQLFNLFTLICVDIIEPRYFSEKEIQKVMTDYSYMSLQYIAHYLYVSMPETKGCKQNDEYWMNRVRPLISIWPKEKHSQNEKVSYYLSLALLKLGDYFPEVVEALKFTLVAVPSDKIEYIICNIRDSGLYKKFPDAVIAFISLVKIKPPYAVDNFKKALSEIVSHLKSYSTNIENQEGLDSLVSFFEDELH